jgi:CheY-like chemotaxis protein
MIPTRQKRILLVDDDPAGTELTLAALAIVDPSVSVASVADGEEALDYLFRRGAFAGRDPADPDVVLLDLKMPKVDGHEVLRQIRAEPRLRPLRVIVLTSSDRERDRALSRELGTDGYMVKPASIVDLIDELRQCVNLLLPRNGTSAS